MYKKIKGEILIKKNIFVSCWIVFLLLFCLYLFGIWIVTIEILNKYKEMIKKIKKIGYVVRRCLCCCLFGSCYYCSFMHPTLPSQCLVIAIYQLHVQPNPSNYILNILLINLMKFSNTNPKQSSNRLHKRFNWLDGF